MSFMYNPLDDSNLPPQKIENGTNVATHQAKHIAEIGSEETPPNHVFYLSFQIFQVNSIVNTEHMKVSYKISDCRFMNGAY